MKNVTNVCLVQVFSQQFLWFGGCPTDLVECVTYGSMEDIVKLDTASVEMVGIAIQNYFIDLF